MVELSCGISGSTGAEVVNRINENSIISNPTHSGWDGTALVSQQALRDFYDDQTITVQGGNFSAKSYPDGSVTGSTDNGYFEMSANGILECEKQVSIVPVANTISSVTYEFPIVFTSTTYRVSQSVHTAVPESSVKMFSFAEPTTTQCEVYVYRVNTYSTSIHTSTKGRWKS